MQAINQVEQGMPTLMDKYTQLQSSIEQRLKWASGANPALNSVMDNFDHAVNEKKTRLMVCLPFYSQSVKFYFMNTMNTCSYNNTSRKCLDIFNIHLYFNFEINSF